MCEVTLDVMSIPVTPEMPYRPVVLITIGELVKSNVESNEDVPETADCPVGYVKRKEVTIDPAPS